ncbi:hypothetical protein JCM19039_1968 [Geomicrobium sp. JCM 19039]|nr:hypothetical protein JCM19039_1968 [Geomicrobium sp. JCM 19039]
MRQCTHEYKIKPIKDFVRRELGYETRQKIKETVHMWRGISTDEIQRVKGSEDKWIAYEHPLIDKNMNRLDCMNYIERAGYSVPPKSSCIGCPFHNNYTWREIKLNDPKSWETRLLLIRRSATMPILRIKSISTDRRCRWMKSTFKRIRWTSSTTLTTSVKDSAEYKKEAIS